jgi:hypothetical protein
MIYFEYECLVAQRDGLLEDYETHLFFCVDKTIEDILTLHLNSDYGTTTSRRTFERYGPFTKLPEIDNFFLITKILSNNIPYRVIEYFDEAWRIYKKDYFGNLDFNIDILRIKFSDTEHLTYLEIIECLCNAFLALLPQKTILEFSKKLIFSYSYDSFPFQLFTQKAQLDFFTQQSSFNYTALVYMIQKDITKLNFFDISRIKKDVFNMQIEFNPFFDKQTEIIKKINKIFYNFGKIKINISKTGTKDEKFKRIYDIYLMTEYPNIYFEPEDKNKLSNKEIYLELLKLGYSYGEGYDDESINASKYHTQIKRDLELIDELKKIEIPFNDYL